ncbi:MAG: hypothetical protein WBA54_06710 [Acidaminobacteraceae bacterium]
MNKSSRGSTKHVQHENTEKTFLKKDLTCVVERGKIIKSLTTGQHETEAAKKEN